LVFLCQGLLLQKELVLRRVWLDHLVQDRLFVVLLVVFVVGEGDAQIEDAAQLAFTHHEQSLAYGQSSSRQLEAGIDARAQCPQRSKGHWREPFTAFQVLE
jgi:hypothetical protein